MSLNFASVKSIVIPEGNVKKIVDPTGRVLWQASSGGGEEPVPTGGIYGVEWDYSQSATTLTRLEDAAGFADPAPAESLTAVGSSPFDEIMPWAGMKRYNIIDGAATYSEDDAGFDMAAYDTMVYIPPFYYKAEKDTVNKKWRWHISPTAQDGFALHPGSGRYIGRYHTSSTYTSVSGIAPLASITRATGRTNSHAKGDNWWQMDFATWCALELLYLVEFADWDSQTMLGTGNNSGAKVNTGGTDGAAYHTVKLSGTSNQYRNVENPYSNLLTWCDGFVASARAVYAGTDNNVFGDTTANLTATGITLPLSDGCIAGFGYSSDFLWAFIPDTINGTDYTLYVSDRVYSSSSVRVLSVGGSYNAYANAGFFYAYAGNTASNTYASFGSRLLFIP